MGNVVRLGLSRLPHNHAENIARGTASVLLSTEWVKPCVRAILPHDSPSRALSSAQQITRVFDYLSEIINAFGSIDVICPLMRTLSRFANSGRVFPARMEAGTFEYSLANSEPMCFTCGKRKIVFSTQPGSLLEEIAILSFVTRSFVGFSYGFMSTKMAREPPSVKVYCFSVLLRNSRKPLQNTSVAAGLGVPSRIRYY